jgi:hypothetical protein
MRCCLKADLLDTLFPSAGIIRIRYKGMISARSIKAPHFREFKDKTFFSVYQFFVKLAFQSIHSR